MSNTSGATSGEGTAYLPENLSSPLVFIGVRVAQSFFFSFGHCTVCLLIYGFSLPLAIVKSEKDRQYNGYKIKDKDMVSDYPLGIFNLYFHFNKNFYS